MATTENSYTTTNSSTTDFSFTFPYIKQADVKVSLDKIDQATTEYSFPNATTVRLDSAPASGVRVRVYRVTDDSDLTATFYPGSAIRSSDLNDNFTQNLYSTQEVVSRYLDSGGNITITEDAGLIFEGATDNDFETTLTVADPTADRTITLPNITGTVITTADTGTVTSTMINDGTINTADLNDNAVTTDKIAANAVTASELAADCVGGDKLQDNAVDSEHYTDGSIKYEHIADSQIGAAKIEDLNVTTAKLAANAVTTAKIADSNVTTPKIGDGQVTTAKIAASNVTTAKIADANITTAKVGDGQVTTAKIADANITTAKIADSNIITAKIGDGQVTTAKLADSNVTTAKIADANIITAKIGDGQVTTAKVADNAVTFAKIGCEQTTITNTDTSIPTSGAVIDYVTAQIAPVGGLEVIATDALFPNTQPASGVVISISDAAGVVFNGSGSSTTGRTADGTTVTINNAPSSLYNETLVAGVGLMVSSTGSSNTYNYHKLLAAEGDVKRLSDDINDFNARYRVASSAPGSANDSGDLYFNTTTPALHVYNGSAWIPGVSTTPNDGTVTTAKIVDDAVTTDKIADGNVGASQLANDCIGGDKLQDNAVNSEHYVDGSIDSEHIADGQISTAKIANDAVDGTKLADNIDIAGTLDVTGAATFDSEVQAGANPYSENVTGIKLQTTGQITARSNSTNPTFVSMDQTGAVAGGATARINANGSAEFASGDATISSAGAATFAGDLQVGDPVLGSGSTNEGVILDEAGVVSIRKATNNNVWQAFKTGTVAVQSVITSDGNASFIGKVTAGSDGNLAGSALSALNKDTTQAFANSTLSLQNYESTGQLISANGGNTQVFSLLGSGTAAFAGDLRVGGAAAYDGVPLEVEVQGSTAGAVGISLINTKDSDASATCVVRALQDGRRGGDIVFGRENANDWGTVGNADGFISFNPALDGTATEKMRIASDGKVGIGTISPTLTAGNGVHIAGGNAALKLQNTNNGDWAFVEYADESNTTKFVQGYRDTGETFSIRPGASLNASSGITLLSDGKVGIGTVSPARNFQVHSTSADANFMLTNSTTEASDNKGFLLQQDGNDAYIWNKQNSFMDFGTNASSKMRIDSAGRLLVGTTTEGDANADNLTIAADAGNVGMTIRSAATEACSLFFSDATTGAGEYAGMVQYSHSSDQLRLGSTGSFDFQVSSTGSSLMRIASDGKVGIGVDNPTTPLEIKGTTKIIAPDGGSRYYFDASDSQGAQFSLYDSSDAQNTRLSAETAYPTFFGTNVGIGTTDPDSTLHIKSPSGSTTHTFTAPSGQPNKIQFKLNNGTLDAEIKNEQSSSVSQLIFSTGSTPTARLTLNATGGTFAGDVGIGVVPTERFVVKQTMSSTDKYMYFGDNGAAQYFALGPDTTAGNATFYVNVGTGAIVTSNWNAYINGDGRAKFKEGIAFDVEDMNSTVAAADVLDDYEEGTFTPGLAGGGTIGTFDVSATGHFSQGWYVKVGQIVHCHVAMKFDFSGSTGGIRLTGLPFNHHLDYGSTPEYTTTATPMTHTIDTSADQWYFVGTNDTNQMQGFYNVSGGAWVEVPSSNFHKDPGYLQLSFTYRTDT